MSNWFVQPDTVRLDLASGGWIEVKRELTKLESDRLTAKTLKPTRLNGNDATDYVIDLEGYDIERLLAWIVDWSAQGPDGKGVPVNRAYIGALNPRVAREIGDALSAHIEAQQSPLATPSAPESTSG